MLIQAINFLMNISISASLACILVIEFCFPHLLKVAEFVIKAPGNNSGNYGIGITPHPSGQEKGNDSMPVL